MEITLTTTGYTEWVGAVDAIIAALRPAAERAVSRGLDEVDRSAALVLSAKSHPELTPTPSLPGEPPALVTGNLVRSYTTLGPYWLDETVVEGQVGPTAVYAAIQEFGGEIHAINYPQLGNPEVGFFGPSVTLPARPYVGPAADGAHEEIMHIWREEISEALRTR